LVLRFIRLSIWLLLGVVVVVPTVVVVPEGTGQMLSGPIRGEGLLLNLICLSRELTL